MNATDFVTLVTPFKDKVYRLAKRLLTSKEEAEDATQEVLIKLWKQKHKIQGYNNVEAFSMTMTKNLCLDRLKSKQAQHLKITHSNYTDTNAPLQQQLEAIDSVNWVDKIIKTLPEQQQIIIQLRDVEQYSFKAISEQLNMKETAIRVALSRARKTIKTHLLKTHNYGL